MAAIEEENFQKFKKHFQIFLKRNGRKAKIGQLLADRYEFTASMQNRCLYGCDVDIQNPFKKDQLMSVGDYELGKLFVEIVNVWRESPSQKLMKLILQLLETPTETEAAEFYYQWIVE